MPVEILVPPLSQTMDTLVLVEWMKQIGEPVTKGEVLFRVETDKSTLDVESPADGILQEILAHPGQEIKIRSSIGMIAEPGEALLPAGVAPAGSIQPTIAGREETNGSVLLALRAVGPLGEPLPPERVSRIFASPRARNLASQRGISLDDLRGAGSGPQGMIVERDILASLEREKAWSRTALAAAVPVPVAAVAAAPVAATPVARRMAEKNEVDLSTIVPTRPGAPITKADVEAKLREQQETAPPAPQEVQAAPGPSPLAAEAASERVALSLARKTIARRMLASQAAAASVTYMSEVDATRLVRVRERLLENLSEGETRPTYTDFLVRILCQVLQKHPDLNATLDGETLVRWKAVHLALAVDTERGLVAPVIRNAQAMGVGEIARIRTGLVQGAAQGSLKPEELSGGTFTLSNLGTLGIDAFTPIINPPQVAILGIGRIRQAPAVYKGKLRVRHLMSLSLTCDHRVVDGAPAARFLQDLARLIENPDLIWV